VSALQDDLLRVFPYLDPLTAAGAPSEHAVPRVERPYSPIGRLIKNLGFPTGTERVLVYGASGNGTTTELLAAYAALHKQLCVIFIDVYAHMHQRGAEVAVAHLQPWEVLAIVGLGLYRFGEEVLQVEWTDDETHALVEGLISPSGLTSATLDVRALAGEIALLLVESVSPAAGVVWKIKQALTTHLSGASLPLGRPERPVEDDQSPRVQRLQHVVNRLIGRINKKCGRPVLLILDGLDRGDRALAQRLFERSSLLARLPCHQLVAAPVSVSPHHTKVYSPSPIANVPVIQQHSPPMENPEGVAFFVRLWRSRAERAQVSPELIPESLLRRVGWASGGEVRLFLQMLQEVVKAAWLEGGVLNGLLVEAVIDEYRRRWEWEVGTTKVKRLAETLHSRQHDDTEQFNDLLDARCVLAYPNETVWYYPHPLLTLSKLRPYLT
jgi:hypothetical protein